MGEHTGLYTPPPASSCLTGTVSHIRAGASVSSTFQGSPAESWGERPADTPARPSGLRAPSRGAQAEGACPKARVGLSSTCTRTRGHRAAERALKAVKRSYSAVRAQGQGGRARGHVTDDGVLEPGARGPTCLCAPTPGGSASIWLCRRSSQVRCGSSWKKSVGTQRRAFLCRCSCFQETEKSVLSAKHVSEHGAPSGSSDRDARCNQTPPVRGNPEGFPRRSLNKRSAGPSCAARGVLTCAPSRPLSALPRKHPVTWPRSQACTSLSSPRDPARCVPRAPPSHVRSQGHGVTHKINPVAIIWGHQLSGL